jgi:phage terminase small subunit
VSDLTPKQEAFCFAYIETGNASEAYRRAYDAAEMSPEAVKVEASRLLDHPNVALTVEDLRSAQRRRHALTADRVLAEYAKIAFGDAGDIFHWGPDGIRVKDMDALTPDQRALVSEVSQTTTQHGGTIRVKLHDKLEALEKIGRHLGIFEKDNAQAGTAAGEAAGKAISEGAKQLTDLQFARWLAFKLAQGANAASQPGQAESTAPEA